MRKAVKVTGISFGIVVLLGSILFVHWFVYPFVADKPNYSDVERVFNRMQFPSDWKEVSSSENRGIAGRQCPAESESACFHKNKEFSLTDSTKMDDVKKIFISAGCNSVSVTDNSSERESSKSVMQCSSEGLTIGADYVEGKYLSVTVYSK